MSERSVECECVCVRLDERTVRWMRLRATGWANGQLNVNAFACDWMSERSVERECVCVRLDERTVTGWNDCDCVAWAPGSIGWKLLFSVTMRHIYIWIFRYATIRMWKEKREKTGIKSFCWEDCFWLWLALMDGKDTNNKQPTTLH